MVESKKFSFFKKNKGKDHNGSESSKSRYNPVNMMRKVVDKYRTPRASSRQRTERPQDSREPLDSSVSPGSGEPIKSSQLSELSKDVTVVEDIRKNRARGPRGRKPPSSHASPRPLSHTLPDHVTTHEIDTLPPATTCVGVSTDNSKALDHVSEHVTDPCHLGDSKYSDKLVDIPNLASSYCGDTTSFDTEVGSFDTEVMSFDKEVVLSDKESLSIDVGLSTSALGHANACGSAL